MKPSTVEHSFGARRRLFLRRSLMHRAARETFHAVRLASYLHPSATTSRAVAEIVLDAMAYVEGHARATLFALAADLYAKADRLDAEGVA